MIVTASPAVKIWANWIVNNGRAFSAAAVSVTDGGNFLVSQGEALQTGAKPTGPGTFSFKGAGITIPIIHEAEGSKTVASIAPAKRVVYNPFPATGVDLFDTKEGRLEVVAQPVIFGIYSYGKSGVNYANSNLSIRLYCCHPYTAPPSEPGYGSE
jgi:hypothetical protein